MLRSGGVSSDVFRWIQKITNSAGFTGAMPTTQMSQLATWLPWLEVLVSGAAFAALGP